VRLVRAFIPVARIFLVAFPAMEVGMNPSRFLPRLVILGDVMGAIEISPGIPPESLEHVRQARRGYRFAQRGTELFDRHSPFYARSPENQADRESTLTRFCKVP